MVSRVILHVLLFELREVIGGNGVGRDDVWV